MIKAFQSFTRRLKNILFLIALVTFFSIILNPKQADASALSDGAHLLSTEEEAALEKKCDDIKKRYDISVRIILSEKITPKTAPDYFQKLAKNKNAPDNLLVLLISTAKNDIFCSIQSFHQAKKAFPESRCKTMQEKLSSSLERGDYYKAIYLFCSDTQNKAEKEPYLDISIFQSVPQFIFCMLLSFVLLYSFLYYHTRKEQRFPYVLFPYASGTLSFFAKRYHSEHCQKRLRRHLDQKNSKITNSSDTYTHTD